MPDPGFSHLNAGEGVLKPAEDHPAQAAVEQHRADDDGMPPKQAPISPSAEQVEAMRAKHDELMAKLAANPPKVPEQTSVPEKMQELAEREVLSTQELWNSVTRDPLELLALEAAAELRRGDSIHGKGSMWPGNGDSAHAAYAVLDEERDELWDEVKARHFDPIRARKEAIQVAAMALRFVRNVCDPAIAALPTVPIRKPESTIYTGPSMPKQRI